LSSPIADAVIVGMRLEDSVTLSFGQHAERALEERGIPKSWVERTLAAPQAVEPDPRKPGRLRAFRAIEERDGRVLRVVYVPGETPHIVTVFFDRARTKRNAKSLR
jgi:hypothetical protein